MNHRVKLLTRSRLYLPQNATTTMRKKRLIVQCDVSQRGLRATLLQEGKRIAYVSRAMTNTEANYGQIEKEHLVIVFAMEKFHHYTFARHVIVQSDPPLQQCRYSIFLGALYSFNLKLSLNSNFKCHFSMLQNTWK